MKKQNTQNRRNFFKAVGSAAIGVNAAGAAMGADADITQTDAKKDGNANPQVPTRKLGKTGADVPVLALGTMFNVLENQIMLYKCYEWGVRHWDTAHGYSGGNSELGIGKFFKRYPERRKEIFLVTKASGARTAEQAEDRLQTSLKRMNTDYIDLFYGVHGLSDIDQMTPELIEWSQKAKKRGVIKHFGFSTHKNMAKNLTAAAKMDGIDAILTTYNFRLLNDTAMQAAVDACHKAGVGLTAMKTQGLKIESKEDKELADYFLKRGFTEGQAKIKMVLKDERISSCAVGRGNLSHQMLNIAAVLDKTELSRADADFLEQYARNTCDGYCAGCGAICDQVMGDTPYVSEVMRYMMYYNSYNEPHHARELFADIPFEARRKLAGKDFGQAERVCPHNIPIGRIMQDAIQKLA